jgi:hypothetical protein
MVWNKAKIKQALLKLHKQQVDLSYNSLARKKQSLVSAAAYHFGSYRQAIVQSGIDYAEVVRRPRWTRAAIIKLLRESKRAGKELHWSAVTKRRDELGKAAFASLQPRLFGKWERALRDAGLDADKISRYRRWNKNNVIAALRSRVRKSQGLNSGALQRHDPGLHAAAVRHFVGYDLALRAAKIDPAKIRQRRVWTKVDVKRGIKQVKRSGKSLSDSFIRRDQPALYGAATRLFGSFAAARAAAGFKLR